MTPSTTATAAAGSKPRQKREKSAFDKIEEVIALFETLEPLERGYVIEKLSSIGAQPTSGVATPAPVGGDAQ